VAWWKVAVPAVLLVALITVGIYYIAILMSPMATVSASISNISKEIGQRTEGTPLESFGILFDSFENGSVTVDFSYKDRWDETYGVLTLHSDEKSNEVAFEADLSVNGFEVDFELYINSERAAARISQFDNNFYGIIFESFRDDFRAFADQIGADQQAIDMIADVIDFYTDILGTSGDPASAYAEYEKLFSDFLNRADISSERVDFYTGEGSTKVRKIELTITDRMIIDFIYEFLDLLENDDSLRALFEASYELQAGMNPYFYDPPSVSSMIRELRNEVRTLERNLRGEITSAFYIGSKDRLLRMDVNFDFQYEMEQAEFSFSLDFGSSAHDLWVFNFNMRDGRDYVSFSLMWDIKETQRGGETSLTYISDNRWGSDTVNILLDWNDRGNFTLSYSEGRNFETLLSGVYTKINDGFRLTIDDPFTNSWWDESLQLEISAVNRSGHIKQIEFINISDWGNTLIDKLEEFFGFGGNNLPPIYQPGVPPAPLPSGITEADLYGPWEFSHGDITYYFWEAEYVEFFFWGEIYSSDTSDVNSTWSLTGNQLTVSYDDGTSYVFTVDLIGDTLVITDSDGDTGYFTRIRY